MKKMKSLLVLSLVLLLSACSSIDYVAGAVDYASDLNEFKNTVPALLSQAVNDETKRSELENVLVEMKSDIEEYNALSAPELMTDAHNTVVEHNNKLLNIINELLPHVEKGTLTDRIAEQFTIDEQLSDLIKLVEDIKNIQ